MIKTYNDCRITVINKTFNPSAVISMACEITQKKLLTNSIASESLLEYLVKAEHTSVFEHCSLTVVIQNVSRSFLAQITRHRMSSFTCGSQHYQEYNDYADIIHPKITKDAYEIMEESISYSSGCYSDLLMEGVPAEEARQVLPNSKAVNVMWTINARSLINFLRMRLCYRNVTEMQLFAEKLLDVCTEWWPNLFEIIGPPCFMDNSCNQGKMRAKKCLGRAIGWPQTTLI